MAYDHGTIYSSLSGSGFTSSCLEGIPFKIAPKFKPPIRVVLPPDIDIRTASRSSALNTEYTFEVEEAVLKWSAEREKQKEEHLELQRQATLRKSQESSSSEGHGKQEDTDGMAQAQPLYENAGVLQPKPVPKPRPRPKPASNYASVTIPNSLIANISNDILQPTPIQSTSKENGVNVDSDQNVAGKSDIDLSWFEKQDDPFDNLELKTINDMEELASVLQNSSNVNQNMEETKTETQPVDIQADLVNELEAEEDEHMYENVSLVAIKNGPVKSGSSPNSSMLDLSKLPPVPPRRDLVGRSSPLPPIGQSMDLGSLNPPITSSVVNPDLSQTSDSSNSVSQSVSYSDNPSVSSSFQSTDLGKQSTVNHRAPVKKPPRTFKYSRHIEPDSDTSDTKLEQSNSDNIQQQETNPISTSFSDGNFSVQFNNVASNPKVGADNEDIELRFDSDHFGDKQSSRPVPSPRRTASPLPRPSSGQHSFILEQSNSESIEQQETNPISTSFSDENFSVQFNNVASNPRVGTDNEDIELRFDSDHFGEKQSSRPVPSPRRTASPPPRPSSGQQPETNPISTSFSDGSFSIQFNNVPSNPRVGTDNEDVELRFDSDHFGDKQNSRPVPSPRRTASPPPRPSSGQSWNKYSPLPSTPVPVDQPQPSTVALPVISGGAESSSRLSKEAQTAVSNLVGMGFPKDRVVRAVERLGEDEKEVVEFLCLVDQLTEKGYSPQLAETALLMFRNSMNQASSFLELFTQFQELGFSGEKIKEALVNTNNDREKTLDILTASS